MFAGPLVNAAKGGAGGGGATLTPLGLRMLVAYRKLENAAAMAGARELAAMRRALAKH
jgi:molybdate transport system regulatory protein